jgi:hypothetical protein
MWVLSCTLRFLCGCFAAPTVSDENAAKALEVRSVRVVDRGGAHWPADDMPRLPTIEVELDDAPRNHTQTAWLVRGASDDDLLADLLDPPLRQSSAARLVPAHVQGQGQRLRLSPELPLAPDAQLTLVVRTSASEAYTKNLRVSVSPSAGARLAATMPAAKSHAVPTNLQAILLRFDGALGPLGHATPTLEHDGTPVETRVERVPCAQLGLGAGDCVRMFPSQSLAQLTTYAVRADKLVDATGAALPPLQFEFATDLAADQQAAELGAVSCAIDEVSLAGVGCMLESDKGASLRIAPSEPVLAELAAANASASALSSHDSCVLSLTGLDAESTYATALKLTDLAGNVRALPVSIQTRPPLADLVIDEIRSDPWGSEPAQELVELLNFGVRPVSLMGFSISTDTREPGSSITTALNIAPGERVLVVAPAFDVQNEDDGALPAGVRVARLKAALSLPNSGQTLVLRDANGARIDMAPAVFAPEGQCVARSRVPATRFANGAFVATRCTPGEASVPP